MKILVGGVPFGRNNIGDEAILGCVARMIRECAPAAEITVSTDDPATRSRLDVGVCPLFGFDGVAYSAAEMAATLAAHDVFLWAGATGLSDYPDRACGLLAAAREAGCRRIIWNVGMNSELNPAKFRLRGRKLALARGLDLLGFGAVRRWEEAMDRAMRRRLRSEIEGCCLVVVRDPESAREIERCGVSAGRVVVGADSALIQEATPWPPPVLGGEDQARLERPGITRVGLCVSAQRAPARWADFVAAMARILERPGTEIVGLPMNPVTDLALLERLRVDAPDASRIQVLAGVREPSDMLALASRMDLLISSRLHLLILGSIAYVPPIGISRGSKVDNFLAPFGLRAAGTVEDCDMEFLVREAGRLLCDRDGFAKKSREVRAALLGRLGHARRLLEEELGKEAR